MNSRPPQITDRHLQRKAAVYIRQSSEEQVRYNVGSTALQRDLRAVMEGYGWHPSRIEDIDEDLGRPGSVPGLRHGLNHLIDRIEEFGIVAVADTSRLTRNLLDLARFVTAAQRHDVLLYHGGQITDFRDPNSAFTGLILGLNASRENQARADLARRARRKKAEAGIATTLPPTGYVMGPRGSWVKDPDPRVREVVALVFDKFLELGSSRAIIRHFRQHNIKLPKRDGSGWADVTRSRILNMLKNPAYAGIYVFGKRRVDPSLPTDARGRHRQVRQPESEWIRIPDHHEPYVAPHLWEEIQRRLATNRSTRKYPAGRGDALVQGWLRCTIHNVTFNTTYPLRGANKKRLARYHCNSGQPDDVQTRCASVPGRFVDRLIETELLAALAPPTIGELQRAAKDALTGYNATVRLRADELRRAEQAAAEAERTYEQADADQPLLKRRLGQRAEDALAHAEELRAHHRLHPLVPPMSLGQQELEELHRRLGDLPTLWRHPGVTPEQRKRVLRTAIKVIHVTPDPKAWDITIEWVGGARTTVTFITRLGVRDHLRRAYDEGLSPREITDRFAALRIMQQMGPHVGEPFDERAVRAMIHKMDLQRPFEHTAYTYIRARFLAGIRYRRIAEELNAQGIRHDLGSWKGDLVRLAVRRLRTRPISAVPPLPVYERITARVRALHEAGLSPTAIVEQLRAEGRLTLQHRPPSLNSVLQLMKHHGLRPRSIEAARQRDALLRAWAPGRSVREVTRHANAMGLLTRRGNPWRETHMARKLAELGLRTAKTRGERGSSTSKTDSKSAA